ncbi:putative dNA packaging protein FI [Escherichia coli Envira 8/11]|nr:putative dNA packaging protein FI [Escherichia coli Envira 8/11]
MRSCPYNWRNHGLRGHFLSVEEFMTKDELIARLSGAG